MSEISVEWIDSKKAGNKCALQVKHVFGGLEEIAVRAELGVRFDT